MATISYYEILDISPDCSQDDIKRAYRRLSLKYHPDKNNSTDASTKFQQINEAYQGIGTKEKRASYDMMYNSPFGSGSSPFVFKTDCRNFTKEDMDNLFKMASSFPFTSVLTSMFQDKMNDLKTAKRSTTNGNVNTRGMSGMSGIPGMPGMSDIHNMFFSNNPASTQSHTFSPVDIFTNMYKENGTSNSTSPMDRPIPIIINKTITIQHAYTGCNIPVKVERWVLCNGVKNYEDETIYVPIPIGIDDGEKITLANKGHIIADNNKGDVKIFITITNDTVFRREGLDLIYTHKLTLKEALCGFSFVITLLNGEEITIHNFTNNIIHPGFTRTMPNKGMKRDDHIGNLQLCLSVTFPEQLDDDVIEKLKELL